MKKFVFFFLIFLCCSSGSAKTSGYTEIINESSNLNLNIVSSVEGKSDKLILFIEDAHCNYIAQKEISSIVEHMMDSGQFGLIAVEGSEGEILTHFFSTFPIEKIRKKYSDKLLKNGLISGEEYFAVQSGNPVRIYGVDDRDVYERNINKFRDFFSLYGSSSDAVDKLKYGFFCIKQENYNDFLFEFEKKYIAFKKKTINLEQLIDYCAVHIIDYYVLLKNYDELSKLNDVISKQENFDYKLLDNQTRKITAYINKNSPKEVSRKCKALVFNHLTGKIKSVVFYKKLYSFAKENMPDNPEIYSYLTKYIEIADAVSGLNYKQLNMELNDFINDCYSTLIKGAKEKKIFKLSKEFEIYENIFNLTLTRTEYNSWLGLAEDKNSFAQFIEKYNKLSKNEPLSNDDRALLNNLFENNISFYRVADERDSILFENTCKVIKSENLNNVILIAGGFHSLRIFEECRKNDISCIVIRPRNVGDNDFKQYAKVLLREDLFSKKTGALNYPDKLRATSFFAEYSFDDINRINEFRNEFIFNAVIDSLEKFSYSEIFEVVKAWRNGFEKAVRLRYPDDTGHMRQSLDMFDYMVTDVFSFGNIEIDPQNRSIVVSTAGKSIKITKEPDSSVSIDTVSEVSKLEKNMGLKTDPIDLKNSQVFISSWTIDDPQSEYLGHGDAHYSVKYIEALNLRGIEPVVILPDDHGELNRTLEKYLSAVKGLNLKFKFAVYDNGYYIALDSSGIPVSRLNIVSNKKPVIIQLCSKIDRKNSDRMRVLNDRFKELTDTVAEPVIVRIPAAGTQVGDMDANHFDLYLTPAPAGTPPRHSIQTGFMVDEDLLEIVKDLKKRGKDFVRNRIITAVSQFSGGRLETVLKSLYGFEIDKITSMNWTFRYLTEKSDAELSSFMKALSVKKENQVVFTFYSDKPQKDMNHKKFLQRFFKFIDLQQADNDRLDTDSNILVINLPPLQSDVFKRLMASSDSAVVSGENSLMEGLIFNKLGVGPTLLFKPAMMDHLSILSNPISSTGRRGLLNKIENYVKLTDLPEIDYFGSYSANSGLDETQRFIYNVIFDPRANTLIRSVFASIVPSVNGLNALTDIIDEIDKKVPADTIVKSHNLTVEAHAAELVDEFFIDDNFDFNSPDNQLKFIETKLKPYVRGLLIDLVKMNLNSHDMKQLVSNFTDDIFLNYQSKLKELNNPDIKNLSLSMKSLLADFLSKISVAENGSFFIASSADLYGQYEYIYLDEQAFSPLPDERKAPRIVFAYVSNNKRLELLENIKNIELAQEIISNFGVGDLYSYYDYQELLPTYTQSVLQEKVLTQHLSEILLDSYLDLTERYKDVLIKYNKVSDMIALVNFVKSYKAKSSIEKFAEFPRRESDLISEIIKLTVAVHTQPHQAGVTHFFRMFDGFIDDYEAYLNDLIRQKVQNGDFSISIRSVGASTGKEAYSLASILEQSLFEYAMNNVYAHIEDQAEREKSADKWIDLWNVNVYAFDVGFARLSLGIEGLYSLTSQDKDFLQRFPEREKIFDEVYDSILPVSVKIKERLRRWFHPVYCNLDEDLSSLLRNKGEITFAMNLLTYVKHQKDVIDVLKKSGSLGYKSFLSYNESFDEEPVVHDMIKGQPLVIPPLLLPSRDSLILTAIANKQGNRAELADYLGISLDEINSILSSGFNRNEAVNDLAIYDDRADKLVSSFMLGGDIDFDAVNHNEVFKQFIDVEFRNAVKNYVMDLSKLKIEPYDITLQLNFFAERVFNAYNGKLKQAGLGQLSDESRNLLNTFLEKIYVLSNGHLFMPQHLEGGTLVEHTYLNLRAFVPMNETEQAEEIITDFVSPQTQQRLVADLNDIRYIANFLSRLDTSVIFSYKDEYDEFKLNTEFSPDGKETALFSIAAASLDFFRQMLSRYESRIKDVYATADIQTLCAHISLLLSEDSSQVENKIDKAVLAEYKKIESDLKKQYFNDGLSVFSREQEHWLDKLELFMDDIIAQKAVNNDLSFSIRTIGASNGQQAYSLAAVLEKSLLKYAENNFFKDDENAEKLAQEWINSWDIKIYAFDENFKRLALVSDGVFNIRSKEKEFFSTNAELSGIFQRGNDTSSLFRRIKPNLRRWIVPVYCNFDGDLSTVKRYPAEVTFAMNVTGYLEYPKELETAIKDSANRSYKSFFVFNNVLSAPPNGFSEPFINSPSNPPSVIEIGNAVIENKLDTQKKLARYFGITQETVNDILSVSAEENITAEKKGFYSLAAKHLVYRLVIRHNGIGNIESDQLIFVNTVFKDYIKNFILSFAVVNMDKTNINLQVSALTNEVLNQYSNLLELNGFSNVKALKQKLGDTINDFLSSLTIVGNSNIFIPKQINGSSYFEYIFVDANPFYPTPENRDKPEVKTELISEKTKDTLVQDMEDARLLRHIVDLFDYRFDLTNYVGEFLPAYDGSHSQYNKLRDNVAHIMLDYIRYLGVNYAAELEKFSGDSSFSAFVELIEDILQTDETVRFNDFRDELRDKLTEFKTAIVYPEHVSGIDWDIRKYGRTSFFRNSKNWLVDLENYLDDLIVQKVADDDFSISVRSIGSATGREAYSLGAVVEQRLLKYARKDIYKDITDETEKEQFAQQWVDKWDVKLYILDISSHRLAVAQEGSYRLLNMEMEFLKKHPEYKDMFAEVVDAGVSEKRPFVALVSDRLKRWAVPVYINLNGDLSPLSRTPSEISFVKNVLYFVKKPSSVINAVLDSTNSAYKSFLGYNHINESPIALSELQKRVSRIEIEGNGHILPPAGKVDAQGVYNLILKSGLSGSEKIAGVLGISEADLSQIYNEQTFRRSVSFVDNYLAESGNGVDLSVFDKMLRKYVIDLSMMMAKEDSEPQEIKKELSAFCEQTLFVFKNRLAQWNIEQSEQQLNEYKNRIADYLSKIIIAPKGHLFVPVIVNGKQMFEHSFIDWQAFLINYDVSKVITELVTEQIKTKIVSDLEDLKYAVQLIESIDIDRLYVDFRQRKNIPFYESNERQLDILTDRIALIALGQFRMIIDKYSDELIKFKGKADMQAFAEYVFDNTKKTDYFQKEQELSPLIDHYISLINAIVPSQQIAPGVTHFFRNSQDWLNQYEMYLNDIIPQKAASGDFTFTLRSVGSSTGKEAYSIMAVLEHELKRYARENIFNNLDAEQREKKVEQWLDIWNITCYAYDNDFTRLASMYEGMYSGLSSLKLFLEKNPDYEDMLDPFFPSFANFVRLNPRLRRWIVPVYADLEGDLTAIYRQKAEITFAFNILPYLDSQSNSAKNLQNALFNSSSEIYKSFLAYNVNFEGAPVVSQQMLDGQPMVLPPVRNPSAVRVLTAVLKMDLNSISDLSRYFGIKADQISAILSERTDFQGKDYVFVQPVADDLFSRFADISVDVQSDTEQMDFIYNQYKQFIKDLFVKFTELNVNPYVTSQLIKTISSGFIVSYESFLKDNNVGQLDELIRKLDKKMSAFMAKIIVLEGGHLILTDNINSVECYEHIYFRQMSFAHNGATARLISESVPVSALDGLVQRLKDVRAIRRVIYLFDLKRFLASYVSYEIIPGYAATEMQIDTIKDHIALILYDYFSVMLDKYSLFLSDKYGEANMQNLVAYIDELYSVTPTSIFGITEVDRSIRRDLHRILKVLNNDYEKPGQTAFYRNYDHWYNQYRRYLTDVIAQKADAGDFTFSLRSIGSSTGKEAYSIASILEQELENYAYDHVFKNIMNNDERRQKSKKWVDLWSVKVYAIDMNIQSLTVSAQGLYRTDEHWVDFIGTYPEYKDKFNDFTIAGEPLADTIVVDNRLRKWIVPVYADLDDGLGVLERYPAEVTFAMNMIPYLNYAEPFMTKLTVKQIASYKAFVVFNEIFASVPNNHYFLDQQPFTLPMTKHLSKTDIARAVYTQNLEFPRQTVDFWGIKAQRLSDIVSASILFDENGLKPIAADLVAKLLANTPAQGTSLADHEYFLNTSFRNFMENYVINLFRNNFTADNIRNILNIIKDNMVSCYSRKLQLSKNENARTLSVNLGKRLEDFLSAADILPKGILILPVLFDGEMYYEETFVDKQAFLADIQIDGVFPTVSQVIPQRTRDNIVARQSQLKYIDKILKISGFKNRFIDSYKDIYTNDNKEVLLYRIQNASLDYFENMVFRYKPLLQSKYANADLANLSDYIEDLIRNTDHIAQPEDKDILADIQSFGKETAKGFVQPENEKFFNGSVFWKDDFLNYLEHLIAEKTILNDFTLSARSLGSLTGKESYSIALLVERTMLAYAQRYVYGNVRSVNDRDRLSKKWLQKWDIRIFALDSNLYNLALIKEGVYNISKDGKDLTSENQGNINIFESMKLVGKDYQSTGRVKLLFRNWIIPVYTHLETDLSVLERCPAEITFAFDIGVADDSQLHDKLRNTVNPFFKSYLVYNKTLGTKAVDIGLIDGQPHVLPAQKKTTEQAIMQIIDSPYGLSLSSFEEIAGFFGISLNDLNDILEHNQPQPDKKTDNLQKALSLIDLMI